MLSNINQNAIKLGSLIGKLELLIESNEALKSGDQAALLQVSLVKEQHIVMSESIQKSIQKVNTDCTSIKEDLERNQKSLKLEIVSFFGKSSNFFESLNLPGTGHQKVFEFIKNMHIESEKLKIKGMSLINK